MALSMSMKTAMEIERKRAEAAGEIAPRPKPAPKKIIICCDGTWQSAVSGKKNMPSNVTRLARDLERVGVDDQGQEWQQIVWYDSGVGTTSGFLGTAYEGAVGAGLEGNIIEAYNFVVLNYNEGDKIYCFGFSRGAYTARTIAGLISDIGICEPSKLHRFHELWEAYKANDSGERFFGSQAYWDFFDGVDEERKSDGRFASQGHSVWAYGGQEIEVVGVFDTVGAIGMPAFHGYKLHMPFGPDKFGFHNVRLNRNIKRAFQALALDEHREAFTPTLWHLPDDPQKKVSETDVDKKFNESVELGDKYRQLQDDPQSTLAQRQAASRAWRKAKTEHANLKEQFGNPSELKQVWFPGVHINAGGGSSDTLEGKGDLEEISTICFAWLVDQIRPYLTVSDMKFQDELSERAAALADLNESRRQQREKIEAEKEKAKKESWGASFYRTASNVATAIRHPIETYYPPDLSDRSYGWGTGEIIDSYTLMYKAGNGSVTRTPGLYYKNKKTKETGITNEWIHPTVGYRLQKFATKQDEKQRYYPAGYKNVKRRKNSDGSWEYVFGSKVLPEYKLQKVRDNQFSFERACILQQHDSEVEGYVAKLPVDETGS